MLDINLFESINGINYGPWAGGQFVAMAKRHMADKTKLGSESSARVTALALSSDPTSKGAGYFFQKMYPASSFGQSF